MAQAFEPTQISEHVYWVGGVDWEIRDFHGYSTSRGTSYNAYLILADRVTLVDTVKAPLADQMWSRIAALVDPAKIDLIISNHSEMDHSGLLPQAIDRCKPSQVVASAMGVKALKAHFGLDGIEAVEDGQTLSLGNLEVAFRETRMLHWPDSMFTWLEADQVLFSNDAFGMHLATTERFVDEVDWEIVKHETAKYYANILMPLAAPVKKLLEKMGQWNLPIKIAATDHGPIWRGRLDELAGWYAQWAEQKPTDKVVITYDTMWRSTAKMADAVAEGVAKAGGRPKVLPLGGSHRSDVATEILEAGALVVGSPTLNNNMFPTVADCLTYLKGLKPKHLIGAAFGSYGWSGEVVGQLNDWLDAMKVERVGDGVKAQYVPTDEDLANCRKLGQDVAATLKERVAND